MIKAFTIILSSLVVVGCTLGRTSKTWERVVHAPRPSPASKDRPGEYADALHAELERAKVPHKVVTYNYPFYSKFDGHGTAERTSVIYRDVASPRYPWWLMDANLSRPIWLPSQSVQQQVSFFLRRPSTVVTLREYMSEDGKSLPAVERKAVKPAPRVRSEPVAEKRVVRKAASSPVMERSERVTVPPAPVDVPMAAPRPLFRPAGVPLRPLWGKPESDAGQ